jgi:hypothetical protein
MAIATAYMAYNTSKSIEVTKDMIVETKRLADISVEQFKIKAYPSFLVGKISLEIIPDILTQEQKIYQEFYISNLGEITANNLTVMQIYIYEYDTMNVFSVVEGLLYRDKDNRRISAINCERIILPRSSISLASLGPIRKGCHISDISNMLIFIKFKVPYDTKYRYESFGFTLQKDIFQSQKSRYLWQEISFVDRQQLIKDFFVSSGFNQQLNSFFSDYDYSTIMDK